MMMNSRALPQSLSKEPVLQKFARWLLRLIGWRVEGELPLQFDKFVLIVAPHTSNWDFVIGLICAYAIGLLFPWPYGIMMKSSAFRGPFGPLMRGLGGIPINRSAAQNVVEQMVVVFRQRERLMLALAPEGTRTKTRYWKSGFYRIAVGAQAPVVMATLDYAQKVGRVGPAFMPSGDLQADLPHLRDFFANVTARHPEKVGEIQFKE
jgi:1-acyl-sn-glycerol-3-phosphate acyltransferase